MLTQDDVVDINDVLELCACSMLTPAEIEYLNALDTSIETPCDKYKISQSVMLDRGANMEVKYLLQKLKRLASHNNCDLKDKKPIKKEPTLSIFGGGL
jgi:hypothetical protein